MNKTEHGFTDAEVDYYAEQIEAMHPAWSVHQWYAIDGWIIAIYDEFRLLGEYEKSAPSIATLRRFAGLDKQEESR